MAGKGRNLQGALNRMAKDAESEQAMLDAGGVVANLDRMAIGKITDTEIPPTPVVVVSNFGPSVDPTIYATIRPDQMVQLQDAIKEGTLTILKELKEMRERLDTLESATTRLVINVSGSIKKEPEAELAKGAMSNADVVEVIRKGMIQLRNDGEERVKFTSILERLDKAGIVTPNTEELKVTLKNTPGFKWFGAAQSFSYIGE